LINNDLFILKIAIALITAGLLREWKFRQNEIWMGGRTSQKHPAAGIRNSLHL